MLRQTKKHFIYDKDFACQYSQCEDFDEIYKFFVDTFINIHGIPKGTMADLCCGTGDILHKFKIISPNLNPIGYDLSYDMISSTKHQDILLVNKSIDLIDETFDNVVSNNAYHHFDDIDNFWKVVEKISHSDTKILISDVVRPNTEEEVNQIVRDILGENSIFETAFRLSLISSYSEMELNTHKGLNNLIIVDTPIENYKLFFIHN